MARRSPIQHARSGAPQASPGARSQRKIREVTRHLVRWFSRNARDLPWRRTRDPYAIWVSEIMLQQTQVKTVVPYWKRWMHTLPTLADAAGASRAKLLKLWEGLGYYTRATNLQRAARMIVRRHQGRFPRQFQEVLALPGIGRYTAGAVCSLAFNQATPVLDGNVVRVLCRLYAIDADPRQTPVQTRLWALAAALVEQAACEPKDYRSPRTRRCAGNCSLLNQALMELGAVACTPRKPRCTACPVRGHCQAFREGRPEELPRPRARSRSVPRRQTVLVVEHDDHLLIRQRPAKGVNGHLWEFLTLESASSHNQPTRLAAQMLGAKPAALLRLCTIQHSITRFRITAEVYQVQFDRRPRRLPSRSRWIRLRAVGSLPFTGAHRQIIQKLIDSRGARSRIKRKDRH